MTPSCLTVLATRLGGPAFPRRAAACRLSVSRAGSQASSPAPGPQTRAASLPSSQPAGQPVLCMLLTIRQVCCFHAGNGIILHLTTLYYTILCYTIDIVKWYYSWDRWEWLSRRPSASAARASATPSTSLPPSTRRPMLIICIE